METQFRKERVLIGQGKKAKVYLWNGFAYKCFGKDHPDSFIRYETDIQTIVCNAGLPTVAYHPSEFSHSIKMDYIDGITLADRVLRQKYANGLEDLIGFFPEIHKVKNIVLPQLKPYLFDKITGLALEEAKKEPAFRFLSEIPEDNTLCHLDHHFLNMMYDGEQYLLIDWVNAKAGNPVYDYARTYVILYEFVFRFSKKYLKMILQQGLFDPTEFHKAVYVMTLHRLTEYTSEKLQRLLAETRSILCL